MPLESACTASLFVRFTFLFISCPHTFHLEFQEYSVIAKPAAIGLRILERHPELPWTVYLGAAGMPGKSTSFIITVAKFPTLICRQDRIYGLERVFQCQDGTSFDTGLNVDCF
jgi:hypothetical protein